MQTVFNAFKIFLIFLIGFVILSFYRINTKLELFNKKIERKIKIDRRKVPNEENFVENIAREIPYLPIEDLVNPQFNQRNFNRSCAGYPSLTNVKIHNEFWQEFQNQNYSYFIFGAYLDNRPTVVQANPIVRVLLMMDFIGKTYKEYPLTYCQLWYKEQSQPIIVPMKEMHKLWYYEWGNNRKFHYAHFVNCPLPKEHLDWIPKSVSLVAQPCDKATNNVRVTYQPLLPSEQKKEFAVCHKALEYPGVDMSYRFVEYLETLKIFGVEKVTMYHYAVHPNTTKVLDYYQNKGFLEYRPMTISMDVSNFEDYRHLEMSKNKQSYRLHELIPYNDCFYRNMYRYKYIAVVDNDELIMPLGNLTNWHDIIVFGEAIKDKKCTIFASFCFRCISFPEYPEIPRYTLAIPEYFYMLQHVSRVREHLRPDWATKCLHSTDYVIGTHNHFPIQWVSNVCKHYSFTETIAQLNHYRVPSKDIIGDPVIDVSLWRFKDRIIKTSTKVLEALGFLSND